MDGSWCGSRQSMHTMGGPNLAGYTPLPVTIPVKKKIDLLLCASLLDESRTRS